MSSKHNDKSGGFPDPLEEYGSPDLEKAIEDSSVSENAETLNAVTRPPLALSLNVFDKAKVEMETFASLVESISTVDDRLKLLWKQIYNNALTDRRNAYIVWTDLFMCVSGKPEGHVLHGDHMAKYMTVMEKANTQLIRLAELVHKAKDKEEFDSIPAPDVLYRQLESKNTKR